MMILSHSLGLGTGEGCPWAQIHRAAQLVPRWTMNMSMMF